MVENLASGNGHEKDKHIHLFLFKDIPNKIILGHFVSDYHSMKLLALPYWMTSKVPANSLFLINQR